MDISQPKVLSIKEPSDAEKCISQVAPFLNAVEAHPDKAYYVLPGFCDVHVHFREPGFSYKETIKVGEKGETLSDMDGLASKVIAFSDDGKGVQREEIMYLAMTKA